ncbi:MAG: PAS domain S-box protein [Dethiobacteria bacterium]
MGKTVNHRLLLENLPDAFAYIQILTDGEGSPVDHLFLEVNPAFEKMTGLRKEQIRGKKASEVYPRLADFFLDWIGTYGRVAAGEGSVCFDSYYEPGKRWYEITAYSDAPGYLAVFFRDITESKLYAAKVLGETTGRLRQVLRATRSSIDIIDCDYNLLYVDEHWQAIYGPPEGRKCYEYFKERRSPCKNCGLPRALETKKVSISEQVLPREGHRIVECHTVPHQNERGEWQVAEFKVDITRRKELEKNLEYRLRFEKMIGDISGSFIGAGGKNLNVVIEKALKQVVEFFGMGRGVIFQLSAHDRAMERAYEWCADGSKPLEGALERFSAVDLPWLFAQPHRDEPVHAFDVHELPAEAAAEKKAFLRQGIRSFLILPFSRGGRCLVKGFLAFDGAGEKRDWTGEETGLLAAVAKIINDALTRLKLERERTRILTMLRESEESLSTTLHSIGDGVIATDTESKITRMNPQAEVLTGWPLEEARGRSIEEVFHIVSARTGRRALNPVGRVLETGLVMGLANDTALIARDGSRRLIGDSAAPIRDSAGNVAGVVLVFSDVTKQYEVQQALQESEARYRTIVKNIADALFIFDFQLKITDLNETAHRMLQYERDELLGANLNLITGARDQKYASQTMERLLRDGELLFEGTLVRRDGLAVPVETSLKVVSRDGEGSVQAFVRDITRRKRDEQQIAGYTAELEKLNQRLNEEMSRARQVHRRTLPRQLPPIEGISLAAHYQPAEDLGGDLYDVLQLGRKVVIYLSDVTGHGADGALLSVFVKHTIKGFLNLSKGEEITPQKIARYLSTQFREKNLPDEYFICIFVAVLDLDSMVLTYTAAGFQDAPLVQMGDGERLKLVSKGLFLSSAFPGEMLNLGEKSISLTPGSTILFNTDGLTEQGAGGVYYGSRLPAAFYENCYLAPREIAQIIREDYRNFNGGSHQGRDDITFLVLQVDRNPRVLERLALPSELDGLGPLREKVSKLLGDCKKADLFLICLHELASNAMEHGNRMNREKKVLVELLLTERYVQASVQDEGEGFDWRAYHQKPMELKGLSERGRGIALVKACSDRLLYNDRGNRATFVIHCSTEEGGNHAS